MSRNSNNTGKIIGALLAGVAIGSALGFLFSSGKGREIRKTIALKTNDLAQSVKEKLTAIMIEANNEFEASKGKALAKNGNSNKVI